MQTCKCKLCSGRPKHCGYGYRDGIAGLHRITSNTSLLHICRTNIWCLTYSCLSWQLQWKSSDCVVSHLWSFSRAAQMRISHLGLNQLTGLKKNNQFWLDEQFQSTACVDISWNKTKTRLTSGITCLNWLGFAPQTWMFQFGCTSLIKQLTEQIKLVLGMKVGRSEHKTDPELPWKHAAVLLTASPLFPSPCFPSQRAESYNSRCFIAIKQRRRVFFGSSLYFIFFRWQERF